MTGVIVADGVPPTTAGVPIDNHGKWVNKTELPITVDRAGVPTRLGFRTPARREAIAVVGKQLPLLVDQNDPARVQIDVAKLNLP